MGLAELGSAAPDAHVVLKYIDVLSIFNQYIIYSMARSCLGIALDASVAQGLNPLRPKIGLCDRVAGARAAPVAMACAQYRYCTVFYTQSLRGGR
jgi:hypothetical protein